ncbi:hypothetical protein [Pedobacter gandavensis]|uniref:Uncharacterized protein n=1 Tax=Pedobacter gandavensis TaxID=2679963 RepID=A0ABR6ETF9_9SPHI|nr:hypothetical protein [Pedobacter gandavensis]MBB2148549.1 hypothetical protein [Pedobacter gandavensis]
MIKNCLLLLFVGFFSLNAAAIRVDTSAYQLQRLKINALLAERSVRFGQYDQSLDARTGIFGFQTKKDIKNSNEILRQIVLNDNNVFKELKVLMDYKDQEVKNVIINSNTTNGRIQNYMVSIKKLQDQNQNLRERIVMVEKGKTFYYYVIAFLGLLIVGMVWFGYKKGLFNDLS